MTTAVSTELRSSTRPTGAPDGGGDPLVRIEGLTIAFPDAQGERLVPVVEDVRLAIGRHEIMGLVGESGPARRRRRWLSSASPARRAG